MRLRLSTLLLFTAYILACGQEPSSNGATNQGGVRSIFDDYTGWFHLQSTTELYSVPRSALDPEIVDMAGGPAAVAARGAAYLEAGEAVEALHLSDMVLNTAPDNRAALRVRLGALRALLDASGEVNHYETYWLRDRIEKTREAAGE